MSLRFINTGLLVLAYSTMFYAQSYIKVEQVSINTRNFSEIAPFCYKGGLLYTSNIKTSKITSYKNQENQYLYSLYYTNENPKVKSWVDSLLKKFEQPIANVGPAIIYGDTFIVSQNFNLRGGKKYKAPVGIFFYDFSKGDTLKVKSFPYNNEAYRVGHPSFSADGKYLYFSSNMPGGYGGFDIYVSEKQDTTWSVPKNLGSAINSAKDEIFPFVISNRLYFSTNRDSLKNLDIYFSEMENEQWKDAVALPEPINSNSNDISFVCDETFENGYFSSDRKKSDDIYHFYSTLPIFEQCDTMIEKNLCYHFFDETAQYIDTLPVIYEWDFGDNTKIRAKEADHCYEDFGIYNVKLIMIDTISDEIQEVANYEMILENPVQPYITHPDTIIVNRKVIFDAKESNLPDCKIKQYVWMFSNGYKTTGKTCKIQFKKPGNYFVKLGIVAINKDEQEIKKCALKEFTVY